MIELTPNTETVSGSPFRGRGGHIIIAGGGTGGHIFPAIAIANAINQMAPGIEILFVGAKGKMEMEKVPLAGYKIEGLDIAGFNRSSLIKNIGLPLKLIKSFFQVRKIIAEFKPDAVIGVGGYSSFPVLKQAQLKGIPTFIHESNSFAGKTNMLLGKKATKIFVASEGMEKFFPATKLLVTGNPVRKSIAQSSVTRSEAFRFFNLDETKTTVLAVGGSLGARSINEALASKLDALRARELQLIWQTGKTTAAAYKEKASNCENVWVDEFITQMEMAYAAADIVISRSGAMAVTELCVAKKPVIFVPFPHASEDHQTVNAQTLVNRKAALMIKDNEANDKLIGMTISLAENKDLQNDLSKNIAKLAVTNADEVIASEILKTLKPQP
ncbi:undecaprenyldiphospho-muramoylpentapeptide beta-N-acetylglucosaminyltransferase [Segetibacter aerophilus]|uniref:UDP-N-acetylglucosamine--N-acetylmuramyl-(pentapeptide) pyrophosphoryl-undecaprenol N-acetylglucosamine transferase n=1 Tax=Segetibacter aerophilus TaxID=670293 RepID=A0A512BEA5_9BACT|nr:undecaprenyldiphospho-muramoylpentapeptide beta-N-acetylglucosaminyltransferase [Segetibacter aerophilus]GEO10292.1 UDP-N-acetylglucosamine--N-acetylmuramyl-(pentapeptide) pyrophosphoryl-undecaprenol N-acetylglucosamine transferase [Segetibacter aerophilus]